MLRDGQADAERLLLERASRGTLDPRQLEALRAYKEGWANQINRLLRFQDFDVVSEVSIPELLDCIQLIDGVFESTNFDADFIAYRGVKSYRALDLTSTGVRFVDSGFVSASLLESVARQFRGSSEDPKRFIEFRVKRSARVIPLDGFALKHGWKFRRQCEVLIDRNQEFLTIGSVEAGDEIRTIMEVK